MRRLRRGLIACGVVVAAGLVATRGAEAQTVTVGVGGLLSAPTGGYFLAPVYADMRGMPGVKLGSFTIRVTWDPTQLQYYPAYYVDSATVGAFGQPVIRSDSSYYGVLVVAGVSVAGHDSVVDLFRLPFYSMATGSTPITLQVEEMSAAGTFTNLMPSATVQNGTFCPALGRWGDLDADGAANSRDALVLLSADVGKPYDTTTFTVALGDVDGDGAVNSRDALIILSYAVGLQIPGQRVLLVAPGACASAATPTLSIFPDTANLVIKQSTQLHVQALGSGADPTTLTGVNWSVADARVASIDATGLLFANDTGQTTVTAALGPGVKVTGVVNVTRRRPVWYVNAQQAARATVQLGTQKYPFASPEYAFPLVSEGDTVRVAPGVNDYVLGTDTPLPVGIVLIGDTLADGTRPVLRGPANQSYYGLYWTGGVRGEVRDLVMRGFYAAAYPVGLHTLVLRHVRIEPRTTYYSYGVYATNALDTLIVQNSDFVADTTMMSYEAIYIGNGGKLVSIQNSTFRNWGDGALFTSGVDSLDMRGSEVGNANYYGVYMSAGGKASTAAALSANYFHDTYYSSIYVSGARTLALDHNVLAQKSDDAVDADGTGLSGSMLTMRGDSVAMSVNGYNWLYANGFDSVSVDSVVVEKDTALSYAYGDLYGNHVVVKHSRFPNVYYEPLYVSAHDLVVDSSSFIGCPSCGLSAYAIYATQYNGVGPKVTVSNSYFQRVGFALYQPSTGTAGGPIILTGNRVDSVSTAFYAYGDSVLAADDTLTQVQSRGMLFYRSYTTGVAPKRAAVQRNQITCRSSSVAYGILTYDAPGVVEDNAITDCSFGVFASNNASYPLVDDSIRRNTIVADSVYRYYGIQLQGKVRPTVRMNHVRFGAYGLYITPSDTATVTVDSNVVWSAFNAGMYLAAAGPTVGHWNNVDSNRAYGVQTAGGQPVTLRAGRFVGNATYGLYNSGSNTILADSNWWGAATGPNTSGADAVLGTATVSPYLTADPAGSTVPPAPAPLFLSPSFAMSARPAAYPALAPSATGTGPAPMPAMPDHSALERDHANRLAERAARRQRIDAALRVRHELGLQNAPPPPKLGPPPKDAP